MCGVFVPPSGELAKAHHLQDIAGSAAPVPEAGGPSFDLRARTWCRLLVEVPRLHRLEDLQMTTKQAFVSEAFHPEDSIRQVWDDLILRAGAKARAMGGVFGEVGSWSVSPPLDDDDFCFHVRLMFSVAVPE